MAWAAVSGWDWGCQVTGWGPACRCGLRAVCRRQPGESLSARGTAAPTRRQVATRPRRAGRRIRRPQGARPAPWSPSRSTAPCDRCLGARVVPAALRPASRLRPILRPRDDPSAESACGSAAHPRPWSRVRMLHVGPDLTDQPGGDLQPGHRAPRPFAGLKYQALLSPGDIVRQPPTVMHAPASHRLAGATAVADLDVLAVQVGAVVACGVVPSTNELKARIGRA